MFLPTSLSGWALIKIRKISEASRTELDAHGHYVSPGWIDMMDQSGIAPKNGLARK